MKLSRISLGYVSTIALGMVMAGVGCSPPPAEVAPQATGQLAALRDQSLVAKAQVQTASNAAKDLIDNPRQDLVPQVSRLKVAVAALNSTRAQAKQQTEEFQQNSAAYFQKWDEMLQNMSAETAAKGKERMAEAKESVEKLRADISSIRDEVKPFMANMNEASSYLDTDTTASGLKVVTPKLQSATDRESAILKKLDQFIADIDSIRSHQ